MLSLFVVERETPRKRISTLIISRFKEINKSLEVSVLIS
jgi:hypothetical protein